VLARFPFLGHAALMIRLVIVAAVRLYREGLAEALGNQPGFHVLASVASRVMLPAIRELMPDVVLLDMATPESLAMVREMSEMAPSTRAVALGISDGELDVLACAEAGVAGYVPREGSLGDLVSVIESVVRGEFLCSPRIAATILHRLTTLSAGRGNREAESLTSRERQILHLIEQAYSNKEIAKRLGIEVATVKNHVHNLLEKLHVHRRAEAAACIRVRFPRQTPPRGVSAAHD
jgi:DNA-binding NarL/FixJ family response regulator